jgi:hypothetical protein
MFFFIHLQPQNYHAKVAQLVEHDLAKVGVAGPNPVFRSTTPEFSPGQRTKVRRFTSWHLMKFR